MDERCGGYRQHSLGRVSVLPFDLVKILTICLMLLAGILPVASDAQAGMASMGVSPEHRQTPQLVTVRNIADIRRLQTLVADYLAARDQYNTAGDPAVFQYIKPGGILYDMAEATGGIGPRGRFSFSLLAIDFAADGETAELKVFDRVNYFGFAQDHYWSYTAERQNDGWRLARCVPLREVPNKFFDAERHMIINQREYLVGDRIYYANPFDGNRLYVSNVGDREPHRLLNDSVRLADLSSDGGLLFFNQSRDNEVWLLGQTQSDAQKIPMEFSQDGWHYFTDRIFSIYRVNDGRTVIQRIYSRYAPIYAPIKITEIRQGWVYFFVRLESDKYFYRVKADGSACESLSKTSGSWCDEDY